MKDKLIVITGPTASGKSDIAIKLADKLESQIISADSQQVYRDMDIGTNKVVGEDLFNHQLINMVNPDENFTVKEFNEQASEVIKKLNSRGKIPIMAGGTGFYIDSIVFDMNYGGVKKDQDFRDKLTKLADEKGNLYLYEKLKKIDPKTASKYHPNELNRVIRALEIYELSGEKPSSKRKGERKLNNSIDPIIFFLNYEDRSILYEKINNRVISMLDNCLLEEFDYLIDKYKLDRDSQSMAAIGYKEIFDYKEDLIDLKELIETIQKNTRRYAKRQITWMKRYLSYPFGHEIIVDDFSKEDVVLIIETILKDVYEI